ncbi:MAG: 4-hydroxy-tetrahydrodipicolinate reductase [Chitinophagales bacterium]
MAETIGVLVTGILGKMGIETARAIKNSSGMMLIGGVDVRSQGQLLSSITGDDSDKQIIEDNLDTSLETKKPDVVVDFTNPQAVFSNARTTLRHGLHCVIGATGLSDKELGILEELALKNQVGVAVIPNFAIGAVVMMKLAQEAARYLSDVEIIELHHDGKIDAPSGTAIKTAEMIHQIREETNPGVKSEYEQYPGARGSKINNIRVHSVRLPGLVAHQEVLFGGTGQTLTIRHDAFNRECFMPGVILTIRKIVTIQGLIYGLENLI